MKTILLGSYTRKSSQGIYQMTLDETSKKLSDVKHIIKEDNPTYLTLSDSKVLYTVVKDGELGGVAAYQVNEDGSFTFINSVLDEAAPPCYVAVDNNRKLVFASNYHQGILYSYTIQEDGSIQLAQRIEQKGNGPHENQNGPHVHYSDLTPDNRLAVCNLGNDCLYTYDVLEDGTLTEVATLNVAPGTGPRHLVFHPNQKIAYLFGELSNEIFVLSYDSNTGAFDVINSLSTLPNDFNDWSSGAAIRITADAKNLYASNRGHNSIVGFSISSDGKELDVIQWISTEGEIPRDFDISQDGSVMIAANQDSNNLSVFFRDPNTGLLTLKQKDIHVPECVCVHFCNA